MEEKVTLLLGRGMVDVCNRIMEELAECVVYC